MKRIATIASLSILLSVFNVAWVDSVLGEKEPATTEYTQKTDTPNNESSSYREEQGTDKSHEDISERDRKENDGTTPGTKETQEKEEERDTKKETTPDESSKEEQDQEENEQETIADESTKEQESSPWPETGQTETPDTTPVPTPKPSPTPPSAPTPKPTPTQEPTPTPVPTPVTPESVGWTNTAGDSGGCFVHDAGNLFPLQERRIAQRDLMYAEKIDALYDHFNSGDFWDHYGYRLNSGNGLANPGSVAVDPPYRNYVRVYPQLQHLQEFGDTYGVTIPCWRSSYESMFTVNANLNALMELFVYFTGDKHVAYALWSLIDWHAIHKEFLPESFGFCAQRIITGIELGDYNQVTKLSLNGKTIYYHYPRYDYPGAIIYFCNKNAE